MLNFNLKKVSYHFGLISKSKTESDHNFSKKKKFRAVFFGNL